MKKISLLISPRSKTAYFNDYIEVAKAELSCFIDSSEVEYSKIGEMDFLNVDVAEEILPNLAKLSFVYGIFERKDNHFLPLPIENSFNLHEDFVFGSKFKGKTNETLTQMLINIALKNIEYSDISEIKLLDPMCGRATTLLWGFRYGMKTKGIEIDSKALDNIKQNVKKWCKVHKQKHKFRDGFVDRNSKTHSKSKFIDFSVNNNSMRIMSGDSTGASSLLKGEKFNLIISDIPYGIQHFTSDKKRNPITVLKACAKDWYKVLKEDGVIVLSFNRYIPKRKDLVEIFTDNKMELIDFSAPHRMSESIVRDIVVFKKISE